MPRGCYTVYACRGGSARVYAVYKASDEAKVPSQATKTERQSKRLSDSAFTPPSGAALEPPEGVSVLYALKIINKYVYQCGEDPRSPLFY